MEFGNINMICKGAIIMLKKEKKPPYLRDTFSENSDELKMINEKSKINLPDPREDPVVANNIATQEFDYTEE